MPPFRPDVALADTRLPPCTGRCGAALPLVLGVFLRYRVVLLRPSTNAESSRAHSVDLRGSPEPVTGPPGTGSLSRLTKACYLISFLLEHRTATATLKIGNTYPIHTQIVPYTVLPTFAVGGHFFCVVAKPLIEFL